MIGILDSGIGGLVAARTIGEVLAGYDITYWGDTARSPYGTKSRIVASRGVRQGMEFLTRKGAKLVVITCDTASEVGSQEFSDLCDVPVLDIVTSSACQALDISKSQRIGVIAEPATIDDGAYERKIKSMNSDATVYSVAAPLIGMLVDAGWTKKPETVRIVKTYLYPLKARQIDTLIVGCSRYLPLKAVMQRKIPKRAAVVDSAMALALQIRRYLTDHPKLDQTLSQNGRQTVFVTDISASIELAAKRFYGKNICLRSTDL